MRDFKELFKVNRIKLGRGCSAYSFHTLSIVLSFDSALILGQTESREPIPSGLRPDVLVELSPDIFSRRTPIEFTSPPDEFYRLLTCTNT